MRRTRKWAFVAQEATRLAALGLAPADIAARLGHGVNRSTVQRWMAAGKLADTRQGARVERASRAMKAVGRGKWATKIRKEYQLDATDDELVKLAEIALAMAHDATRSDAARQGAMSQYRAIVKQLALVARAPEVEKPEPVNQPRAVARPASKRPAVDPRKVLMAVK